MKIKIKDLEFEGSAEELHQIFSWHSQTQSGSVIASPCSDLPDEPNVSENPFYDRLKEEALKKKLNRKGRPQGISAVRWSKQDDDKMLKMFLVDKKSIDEISVALKRSRRSISHRIHDYNKGLLPKKGQLSEYVSNRR